MNKIDHTKRGAIRTQAAYAIAVLLSTMPVDNSYARESDCDWKFNNMIKDEKDLAKEIMIGKDMDRFCGLSGNDDAVATMYIHMLTISKKMYNIGIISSDELEGKKSEAKGHILSIFLRNQKDDGGN